MSQYRDLRQLVKDEDDPGRPGLMPSVPDVMGYVLAFLVCWGIYTLVVKGFAVIEEKKESVKETAVAQQEKLQKVSRLKTEIVDTVREKTDELQNQRNGFRRAMEWFEGIWGERTADKERASDNRF